MENYPCTVVRLQKTVNPSFPSFSPLISLFERLPTPYPPDPHYSTPFENTAASIRSRGKGSKAPKGPFFPFFVAVPPRARRQ